MNSPARPNQALVDAMDAAGMTGRSLAALVGTTPQAVSRWRTDADALPHRRVRALVAKALNVPLQSLWPEPGDGSQAVSAIKEWSAYLGVPAAVWEELVRGAEAHFDICSAIHQHVARMVKDSLSVIRARAEIGQPVQVRILGVDPDGDLIQWREQEESTLDPTAGPPGWMADLSRRGLDLWTAELAGINGVEIRVTNDRSLYSNAVFRFDDRMITYPYTKASRTLDLPAALLARADVGGIFDSLAGHIDRMWKTGVPYEPPAATT